MRLLERIVILISGKAGFRTKESIRGKEEHDIITKGSIVQENITILNISAPTTRASKYMRQN